MPFPLSLPPHTSLLTSLLSQAHLCIPLGPVVKLEWLHSFPDVVGGAPAYLFLTTSSLHCHHILLCQRQAGTSRHWGPEMSHELWKGGTGRHPLGLWHGAWTQCQSSEWEGLSLSSRDTANDPLWWASVRDEGREWRQRAQSQLSLWREQLASWCVINIDPDPMWQWCLPERRKMPGLCGLRRDHPPFVPQLSEFCVCCSLWLGVREQKSFLNTGFAQRVHFMFLGCWAGQAVLKSRSQASFGCTSTFSSKIRMDVLKMKSRSQFHCWEGFSWDRFYFQIPNGKNQHRKRK